MNRTRKTMLPLAAGSAIVLGLGAGSYGIARAASGSSAGTSSATASSALVATSSPSAPSAGQPWGGERSDETLLTGDTASKVRALALAKVPGATIVRAETDADGHAAYEVHMVEADGSPVTVYVDKDLQVVSVETGGPGRTGASAAQSPTA